MTTAMGFDLATAPEQMAMAPESEARNYYYNDDYNVEAMLEMAERLAHNMYSNTEGALYIFM